MSAPVRTTEGAPAVSPTEPFLPLGWNPERRVFVVREGLGVRPIAPGVALARGRAPALPAPRRSLPQTPVDVVETPPPGLPGLRVLGLTLLGVFCGAVWIALSLLALRAFA